MMVAESDLPYFEAMLGGSTGWEGPGPHRHDALSPISFAAPGHDAGPDPARRRRTSACPSARAAIFARALRASSASPTSWSSTRASRTASASATTNSTSCAASGPGSSAGSATRSELARDLRSEDHGEMTERTNPIDDSPPIEGDTELDRLVARSRLIGADPTLVVHGGGNTSTKIDERRSPRARADGARDQGQRHRSGNDRAGRVPRACTSTNCCRARPRRR